MIGSLRGSILDCDGTELLVEVGGVGYRLQVTPNTVVSAGEVGDDVFVWVHHHIREDNQQLYGFTSRDERNVFEVLIGRGGRRPENSVPLQSYRCSFSGSTPASAGADTAASRHREHATVPLPSG